MRWHPNRGSEPTEEGPVTNDKVANLLVIVTVTALAVAIAAAILAAAR